MAEEGKDNHKERVPQPGDSDYDSEEADDDYCPGEESGSEDDELADDVVSDPDCPTPAGGKARPKKAKGTKRRAGGVPKKSAVGGMRGRRAGGLQLEDSDEEREFLSKIAKPTTTAAGDDDEGAATQAVSKTSSGDAATASAPAPANKSKTDDLWAELNAGSKPKAAVKSKTDDLWAELQGASKPKSTTSAALGGGTIAGMTGFGVAAAPKPASAMEMMGLSFPSAKKPGTTPSSAASLAAAAAAAAACRPTSGTYTVTEKLDYAGEEVEVTKKIEVGSEADIARQKSQEFRMKRGTGTALDALVAGISGKKKTCSTLEKSASDWDTHRVKEKLEDELDTYRKDGYLQKVAFLDRTDAAQAEILRESKRGRR